MSRDTGYASVRRQSLSDGVFAQLRDRILSGDLAAGEELPSERLLAELLGVNRGAVREGLKRLEQARLIQVRHGGATQVLDWQREAGLELLPSLLIDANGQLHAEAALGIVGLREALAPAVARAAARQADRAALGPALHAAVAGLRAAGSAPERQDWSHQYWSALVDGSRNIAFRLAFNSLQGTYQPIKALLAQVLDGEFRDADTLDDLCAAVLSGAPERAAELASRHVAIGTAALQTVLQTYQRAGGALLP